jgi:ornithine cyclodeaminase/alanine dehydrogenase
MKTLVLTKDIVEKVVTMGRAVDAVERAFAAFGRDEAAMPAKVYLSIEDHGGDFRAMPCRLGDSAGIKWVNVHPHNRERHGLPTVMGVFVLNDPSNAFPLAIMDATWLTAVRTGAAGAVASKHLAKKAPRTISFIGAGVQARTLHAAHRVVFRNFEALTFDRRESAAKALANEIGGRAVGLEEAVSADIVCTATPSRVPFVESKWLQPGAHVNAMGADAPGKQELSDEVLTGAAVYIDDIHQAEGSGEINVPLSRGTFTMQDIAGTLGNLVAGRIPKPSPDTTTVFDSTGLAIQDVAVARVIYDEARARGLGLDVDMVGLESR